MRYVISCLAIVLFVYAGYGSSAFAQDRAACADILKSGVFDEHLVTSEQNRFSQLQDFVRSSTAQNSSDLSGSGRSLGLNLEGVLTLNFGGHDAATHFSEWRSAFLQSKISDFASNDTFAMAARRASDSIVNAWKACVTTLPDGFFLYVTPDEDYAGFTVHTSYKPAGQIRPFKIKSVVAPNDVHCEIDLPRTVDSGRDVFRCAKPPDKSVNFVLATDEVGPSNEVIVPGRTGDRLQELSSRLDALAARQQSELEQVKRNAQEAATGQLRQLRQGLATWSDPETVTYPLSYDRGDKDAAPALPGMYEPRRMYCPAGTYVVGLRMWTRNNGADCAGCTSALALICKSLNAN